MKHLLREYIRLICESPLVSAEELEKRDDTWRRWYQHALIKAMKLLNLKLIPSGEGDEDHDEENLGVLGKGASGVVFEVEQNGKHMALKLTRNDDDAKAYENIKKIKEKVPAFVATALPTVYKQISNEDSNFFFATLLEPLKPLPHELQYNLYGVGESGLTQGKVTQAGQKFSEMIDDVLSDLVEPEVFDEVISHTNWSKIKTEIASGEFLPGFSPGNDFRSGQTLFYNLLRPIAWEISEDTLNPVFDAKKLTKQLLSAWEEILPFKGREHFPQSGNHKDEITQLSDKKAMKLQVALRWLTKNGYIKKWRDAHSTNVMIRPSTGDYVIVDVGLFQF